MNRLIFAKKNRLLNPGDYQRVFKQGKKQRGRAFTIICCASDFSHGRLGLAIAKRNVPSAVERNRVRRIIRESFRHHQIALQGIDIVVTAQRELNQLSNAYLHEDLKKQWLLLLGSLNISC